MKRLWTVLTIVVLAGMVLSASCGLCRTGCRARSGRRSRPGRRSGGFVTRYQYDGERDPASDERAGNQYLRDTIPVSMRPTPANGTG